MADDDHFSLGCCDGVLQGFVFEVGVDQCRDDANLVQAQPNRDVLWTAGKNTTSESKKNCIGTLQKLSPKKKLSNLKKNKNYFL